LDEHINPEVGCQLRRQGCDVVTVEEAGLRGIADDGLLTIAADEKRVLVTYNIGDFQLLLREWHRTGRHHSGILFVSEKTASQRSVGPLVRALKTFISSTSSEPGWLDDHGIFLTRGR
jgi:hypothetical protein